jgi:hypothetical protein
MSMTLEIQVVGELEPHFAELTRLDYHLTFFFVAIAQLLPRGYF